MAHGHQTREQFGGRGDLSGAVAGLVGLLCDGGDGDDLATVFETTLAILHPADGPAPAPPPPRPLSLAVMATPASAAPAGRVPCTPAGAPAAQCSLNTAAAAVVLKGNVSLNSAPTDHTQAALQSDGSSAGVGVTESEDDEDAGFWDEVDEAWALMDADDAPVLDAADARGPRAFSWRVRVPERPRTSEVTCQL